MKRMLFYTYWNFENGESNGICNKIQSQKKVFEKNGYEVDFCFLLGEDYYINDGCDDICLQRKNKIWTKPFAEKQLRNYVKGKKYDCAYMRYNCADFQFIKLLKDLRKQGTCIILEIPTFPYDKEYSKNLSDKLYLFIDKIHRRSLKKYVKKILTFHQFDDIFDIPTIKTVNGIDVDSISEKKSFSETGDLHLICVAMFSLWHGLERLLKGMVEYYSQGPDTEVFLHVVGDGEPMEFYQSIVNDGKIDKYVIFHGLKNGRELDEIYDQCDIAVETLGGHRINLTVSSTMKSREYLLRGLPYVSEINTDILPENWKYLIRVPYDESNINVMEIVAFYKKYMSSKEKKKEIALEIRNYAIDKIEMGVTLKEVLEYYAAYREEE